MEDSMTSPRRRLWLWRGIVLVVARAILYERVPPGMQGRVFALQSVLSSLAAVLPLILVGVVAAWLGPRAVLVLVAMVNAAAALYALRLAPGPTHPGRAPVAPVSLDAT